MYWIYWRSIVYDFSSIYLGNRVALENIHFKKNSLYKAAVKWLGPRMGVWIPYLARKVSNFPHPAEFCSGDLAKFCSQLWISQIKRSYPTFRETQSGAPWLKHAEVGLLRLCINLYYFNKRKIEIHSIRQVYRWFLLNDDLRIFMRWCIEGKCFDLGSVLLLFV